MGETWEATLGGETLDLIAKTKGKLARIDEIKAELSALQEELAADFDQITKWSKSYYHQHDAEMRRLHERK